MRSCRFQSACKLALAVVLSLAFAGTAQAEVLVDEAFDDGALTDRGWYDSTSVDIVTDGCHAGGCLRYHYSVGDVTPSGRGAMRIQFPESEVVYLRYFTRYSDNWEFRPRYGPHELYFLTNMDSRWIGPAETHLTVYVEHVEGRGIVSAQDTLNVDMSRIGDDLRTATEARGVHGCNGAPDSHGAGDCYRSGDVYRNGRRLARSPGEVFSATPGPWFQGDWHEIIVEIRLNTVGAGTTNADGVVRYYFDGEPLYEAEDVVLRTSENADAAFEQFLIGPYFHDGSPRAQDWFIDELVIADTAAEVGLGATPTPPTDPTDPPPMEDPGADGGVPMEDPGGTDGGVTTPTGDGGATTAPPASGADGGEAGATGAAGMSGGCTVSPAATNNSGWALLFAGFLGLLLRGSRRRRLSRRAVAVAAATGAMLVMLVPGAADASICDDPAAEWLMCEDFEGADAGWASWFASSEFVECRGCSDGTNNPDRLYLSDNADHVFEGNYAMHMPAAAGANFQGAELVYRHCAGEGRQGCDLINHDQLYLRTRVKLAADHNYVHHFLSLGGTRPNAYWEGSGNAGCRPNGYRHAGTTVDFNNDRGLFFYTYHPEMRCDSGGYCSGSYATNICNGCAGKDMACDSGPECCWGNLFRSPEPVPMPRGEWACLEVKMKINTPGSSDGEMAFWLNDTLIHEERGMNWRDVGELGLNRANMSHYIANGDADRPNRISFDDFIVSTERVGCDMTPTPPVTPEADSGVMPETDGGTPTPATDSGTAGPPPSADGGGSGGADGGTSGTGMSTGEMTGGCSAAAVTSRTQAPWPWFAVLPVVLVFRRGRRRTRG
ncbi:MAG: hypothetical protein DRJ42_12805 [Deltaproteobacteria bacterium]|nr:MAG: hypothetical protein DRJ42_12805 [Deltaproteobacteria bacterium]